MADLLLNWLNHELQLSTRVTDVAVDFASGFLLGEILHRLNQQHNFADFMRSSSADAKIVNFCLLEPSLRNLNIKFDANVAAAIMNEKRDAATKLLYQIKVCRAKKASGSCSQCSSAANNVGAKVPSRKSVGYGIRSLTTALGTTSDKKKNSTSGSAGSVLDDREVYYANNPELEGALSAIKQQKQQREHRKENLARRRKRFVQECVYTHSRIGSARVTSFLESVVLRGTNSEKEVQDEMDGILVYKEVVRENRAMRSQEYVNQEELDTVAAVDRDTSSYHSLVLQFEDDTEMQTIQQDRVKVSIEAADHHLSEILSRAIMTDMVEFVLFIAAKREETLYARDSTVLLAPETWAEYKTQFASCHDLRDVSMPTTEDSSQTELLDRHEFEQYLAIFRPFCIPADSLGSSTDVSSASPWCPPDSRFLGVVDTIEDCFVLGEEIKYLRWTSHTASLHDAEPSTGKIQEQESSVMANEQVAATGSKIGPYRQLRILIFGPPFAGKETQAKRLGEKHNLAVLSVHELIQNVIHKQSELGRQVADTLSNGNELPPELYGRLIVETLEEIEAEAPIPTSNNEKENVAAVKKSGWVIYDLPGTEQHGRHLEEQLTGYVDPELIPSPYDFESAIAPGRSKPALSPTLLHGKSGVDLVFYINCATNTVLDRCLGQVEDEATGQRCHLLSNPPPDDSIVRHRLHHVDRSAHSSELLSLDCLTNDAFACDQKAWYAKFQTLHEVPPNSAMTVEEIHETMSAIVDVFEKKKAMEMLSLQHEKETNELALMASEEERHRRLFNFESSISEAQHAVVTCEASLQEAEEAKAKKEDITELRQAMEEAQQRRESAIAGLKSWMNEEQALRSSTNSEFSGELVPAMASVLVVEWDAMEAAYISSMKANFSLQRGLRRLVAQRSQMLTTEFCEFMRRSDQKQVVVNQFQRRFNEVIDEMRYDALTKVELHARVDMLQDELEALTNTRSAESEEELNGMVGDGWTTDTCQQSATIYQMALQAECDRFRASVQLLIDGYYAASSDRSQLTSVVENWKAHQSRLELVCKVYHDTTVDVPQDAAPSAAAAAAVSVAKGAPKGRGKASTPVIAAPVGVATAGEDPLADSSATNELLAEYDRVLERCEALVGVIAPSLTSTPGGEVAQKHGGADPLSKNDVGTANLMNGIRYEHALMQRRVRFLQEATQTTCDQITRSMLSVEFTLRDVLADRKEREQVAVAALIEYIRRAIEAEVALPAFIDVTERFPITVQLREDTMVRVDVGSRLFQRAPPEAPPTIEETHAVLLNDRQRGCLQDALESQSLDGAGLLPLCILVETMLALTSLPDALPEVWRRCPPHAIAQVRIPASVSTCLSTWMPDD
ncbi:hypothetical protein BBJ28_00006282 [Nothophytophthora sp. Chile5]|nr:hypothetical protein BBJ28_00006282 [Nothophytophthora sp. Chile5]